MEQLYFGDLNTNSKKFTVTVNFIQKKKRLQQGKYYFV